MSRGRKPLEIASSDWEKVFYESVGTYVQLINHKLTNQFKSEPLSNHIRIAGGYAFKSSEYKKKGIPVIRISDFSNEQIILKDVVYYEESRELEKFELKEGDIVIALTGGTIAKLGIVQKGIGKLYLNQRVGKFEILNPNEFENEYVYWIARSVQSIIKGLAWGAAIPNVSPKQIEELKFPIPDKRTQRGIIDFLNNLKLDKLEKRVYFNMEIERQICSLQSGQITGNSLKSELSHQNNLLTQLRQSFLREAMQGKLLKQDPKDGHAKDLLEKIKEGKTKSVKKEKELPPIKPEELPFVIPENWVWCRFSDVVLIESNLVSPYDFPNHPHVAPDNIEKSTGKLLAYKTVKEDDVRSANHYFYAGQLVYSKVRPKLNKVVLVDFEGLCSADMYPLRSLINPLFLKYYMLSEFFLTEVDRFDNRVKMPKINQNQLSQIPIILAPLAEQDRIVKKLIELMTLCEELQESIQASREQNEYLLQQVLKEALMLNN